MESEYPQGTYGYERDRLIWFCREEAMRLRAADGSIIARVLFRLAARRYERMVRKLEQASAKTHDDIADFLGLPKQ